MSNKKHMSASDVAEAIKRSFIKVDITEDLDKINSDIDEITLNLDDLKNKYDSVYQKISKDAVKISSVNFSINTAAGNSARITAPAVSGYKFICWIHAATVGWTGSLYFGNAASSTVDVINAYSAPWTTGSSGSGTAFALYVVT